MKKSFNQEAVVKRNQKFSYGVVCGAWLLWYTIHDRDWMCANEHIDHCDTPREGGKDSWVKKKKKLPWKTDDVCRRWKNILKSY